MPTSVGTIKHRHQSVLPEGASDVDVSEWNDSEILAGGTNGDVVTRDTTQGDGWGWSPLAGVYAPLASPALAGVPTAPTAAPGTSTTQVATTAFVTAAVPAAPVWVPVAYSAANFVGAGGMTWTVDAGDHVRFSYLLNDKTMKVSFWLDSTTLSGTASTEVRITIPAGKTSAQYQTGTFWRISPSPTVGYIIAPIGATYLSLYLPAVYALGTNTITLSGTFEFQIN